MHLQLRTWQFILRNLQQHIPVVMLYVIESKGSSPGRQGFIMAVNSLNELSGSIGGGVMEHKFVELAKTNILRAASVPAIYQQFHDKRVARNQSGMICSGEQTIFMYPVKEIDRETIGRLIHSLETNQHGCLQLSEQGIKFTNDIPGQTVRLERMDAQHFLYTAQTGYLHHLYIVGGGHVAWALSQLMNQLDFHIHLLEDRDGLNTLDQNQEVQEKIMLADYTEVGNHIPAGENIFVVIMTVGYRTDKIALASLLGRKLKYLGLLGSTAKIDKMFSEMVEEGTDPVLLSSIHAPSGIPIKSQTPQEIAISIAAEMIQVKNQAIHL